MESLKGGLVLRLLREAVNKGSAYFRYAGSSLSLNYHPPEEIPIGEQG